MCYNVLVMNENEMSEELIQEPKSIGVASIYKDAIDECNYIGDFMTFKWIHYTFPSKEYDILMKAAEDIESCEYHGLPCYHSDYLESELGIKYFNLAYWKIYR